MPNKLTISLGQYSDKGRKPVNQDFIGASVPTGNPLATKGIALAIADGISSSGVSQSASESAVTGFIADYYCTSDAWSVKKSAFCVLAATNSWLHAQTHQSQYRYDKNRGYVCTFSGLILKSATAHLFHCGDARIYRIQGKSLEPLTNDHRVTLSSEESYLARALGITPQLEIDYRSLSLAVGDVFLLVTDGVYEHLSAQQMLALIESHQADLDTAAQALADAALSAGSTDNLSVQIARVETLPDFAVDELQRQAVSLPIPPVLAPRSQFEGYTIVRQLYASSRSHVYLATDNETGEAVALKTPSVEQRQDAIYIERFLLEDWIARRINNAHVLKPCSNHRKRQALYVATEHIEGCTLRQWMIDNPRPALEQVRQIVEQVARGLQAFHRLEMLHQDIRPDNIMIDTTGTVKIIDFGATRVAGLTERQDPAAGQPILGTLQYTAPEYFLGEPAGPQSDLFSLGVIAYQMLCGRLPYGTEVAKARTKAAQNKLRYRSVLDVERDIPVWVDYALKKAVHPNPYKRYEVLSEFIYDLRHPNNAAVSNLSRPLVERHPVAFWQSVSFALACVVVYLLLSGR